MAEPERIVMRAAGALAEVVPALGASCVRWRVDVGEAGEAGWEVLDSPPDLARLQERPTRWGVPVLFPFPNRIRGGRIPWRGRVLTWSPLDSEGNGKHGFAKDVPWDVVDVQADRIRLRLDVSARPALLHAYPFPCVADLQIALSPQNLAFTVRVTNSGREDMPFGFGLHPYLKLPFSAEGTRGATTVRLPVARTWALVDHVPTGAQDAVHGRTDFREPRSLGDDTYDDVFGGSFGETARVVDPASGRAVEIEATREDGFTAWVLFAPPERDVVAVEPYTCVTDVFNLAARGIDAGLQVLAPGATWQATATLRASLG